MSYKYKFSVIIPLYNVEKYIKEALESVIHQTIGFEDIEIILVNDGSSDSTEEICLEYTKKYPNNIKYIYQKNKGVSSARNKGLKQAEGKYISFLDADDYFNLDVFEQVWNLFESNYNDIDIITTRQKFFGAKTGYTSLDYKFKSDENIIDINDNPRDIVLTVTASFFKHDALKKYKFDERLKYGEDAKFITEVLLQKEKYGILKDAIHNFRKREDSSSATQNSLNQVTRYTDTINYYYKYLFDLSFKKYNKLIPYIAHILVNGVKYRVIKEIPDSIPKSIKKEYINNIINLIKNIDDEIIISTKSINYYIKLYLLSLKHNDISKDISISNNRLYYKDLSLGKLRLDKDLTIDLIKVKNKELFIKGNIRLPNFFDVICLSISLNNNLEYISLFENKEKEKISFKDDAIDSVFDFNYKVCLKKRQNNISFFIDYDDNEIQYLPNYIVLKNNKKISENGYCIKQINDKELSIRKKLF